MRSVSPDAPAPRRGRPPRSDEERAAQRARLVAAAMDAVRRKGPDLSIEDMAAEAGVSKPVLYDEFGDKLGVSDAMAVVVADQLERQVLAALASAPALDIDRAVRTIVEALVGLIDAEPAIYAFLVRSIRTSDRGFLDNALVRSIHERARVVVGIFAPGVPADEVEVLTDGLFGFVFAAVESWTATRRPDQQTLVDSLALVIREGFRAVAEERQ